MKKVFSLVPIALFGLCLVFNSCSEQVVDVTLLVKST
jgi:hypothetical protein